MTAHGTLDPLETFRDSVAGARATAHSKRLDTATQAALNASADALKFLVPLLEEMRDRIKVLEANASLRVHRSE